MYRLIMSYTSHLCRETTFEVKDSEIYYKLDHTKLLWIRHWYYCMKGQMKYRVQFLRRNNCNVYILFISVERLVKLVNIQFAVVWTWPIYSFYSWDAYSPGGGFTYAIVVIKRNWTHATKLSFLILLSLHPGDVNRSYFISQ